MFSKLKEVIKKAVSKLFNKNSIQKELGVEISISDDMTKAIELWSKMYQGEYDHINKSYPQTLNLASSISSEIARLVTVEFESEIVGNDYLNEQYQAFLKDIRKNVEYACAKGGVVFKPRLTNDSIDIEVVHADKFLPVDYTTNGNIKSAVFVEYLVKGKSLYTRIEFHELTDGLYYIYNSAYVKHNFNTTEQLGKSINLDEVEEWASIDPVVCIRNINKPLFTYFKMPLANNIDFNSPLGVAVFSRAIDLIKEADYQYSRVLWEFEGSELAIDVDTSVFETDPDTGETILPKGKERLYRTLSLSEETNWNVFSPEIRDSSLFNGLNNILRKVEFSCGLAYGTLSDIQETDKTATEIKSSKQRSYSTVKDIQNSLQDSLEELVCAMKNIASLYNLMDSDYEISFNFDDSLVLDKEAELLNMRNDVSAGILRPEIYLAKKYGVSEEEALKMMPEIDPVEKNPFSGLDE